MSGHQLILIRDGNGAGPLAEAATRILETCPNCRKLKVKSVTIAEALNEPAVLDTAHVAWVVADADRDGELFEVVGQLQDRHIPVMLTRAGEQEPLGAMGEDGVVICPPGADPDAACAMIHALRSQVSVLREMKAEIKLLHAHHGGLADQIGRFDEELRLAAQLQREFLPKTMLSVGDVGFRVLFRPAGYVSGDIYDVIRLDERHLGFFLADAVGHGVPAALLTMYIKRSLHTKKIDPTSPRGYRLTEPSEALDKLNRDLVESQGGQVRFATAVYGVIDCETRELCIARAGHPFPILLRGDGQTELLEPDGGLLGVFAEETYQQICVKLNPGDRLLIYSDGFEMAFPGAGAHKAPDRARGPQRVASTQYAKEFEDLRHGTLDDALLRLQEKLDSQTGSLNQRDDLTILCLGIAHRPQADVVTSQAA